MARPTESPPIAATAVTILRNLAEDETTEGPLLIVCADERRARDLHAVCVALDPRHAFAFFPEWDVLPYDRLEPSPAVMGARMGVLRWLTDDDNRPDVLVTTAPALLRRVSPRAIWPGAHREFRPGEALDPEAARAALLDLGYVESDVVVQPGEIAIRGRVIDVFPAAADLPCRILFDEDRISAIRSYDPMSQTSEADSDLLIVDPSREDLQMDLPRETIFDYAPGCRLVLEQERVRVAAFFEQIAEGAAARGTLPAAETPQRLYLTQDEWSGETGRRAIQDWDWLRARPAPRFVRERNAGGALDRFLDDPAQKGATILLTGDAEGLDALCRRAKRGGRQIGRLDDWGKLPAGLVACASPLQAGAIFSDLHLAIVAAADFLGSRVQAGNGVNARAALVETELKVGDVVVHRQHGVAILEALETVETPGDGPSDFIRLRYGDDAHQMIPVDDLDLIWRYGADQEAVKLDRLDRDSWAKRQAEVAADIAVTARRLVDFAREKRARTAPKMDLPADRYERFAARFPYPLTPDQSHAISAVLDDLESGRRMDRLVCGDVGFGKTEVALRAAAVAALAGWQVAVLAPTTLLARQHFRTFQRRFADLGVGVAELSRLVDAGEARQTKARLKSGDIRIVVGTHAVCGRGVGFDRLGLVIIDEEQKFGAAHKEQARALAERTHVLTMTATPIPRTLQAGLAGLQDISVIATPPHRRIPIRTIVADESRATIRDALMREKRRGGQSFFVTPRVANIDRLREDLKTIVPELSVAIVHGKMKPAEVDDAMLSFAEGHGDVLLATGIVESGLDVPAANTILVHEAGRFGVAQLHQLRGRVGRGARRAFAILFKHGGARWAAAERRLNVLAAHDRLGAGFQISAQDLERRGAGDLFGEDQAGHVKLIGAGLYQELLAHALAVARGESEADEPPPPEVNLGLALRIPDDYAADPDVRLTIYNLIATNDDAQSEETVHSAIADRFGPLPVDVERLIAMARVKEACRRLGIIKLDVGPNGMAATFTKQAALRMQTMEPDWTINGTRIVSPRGSADPAERLALLTDFMAAFEEAASAEPPRERVAGRIAAQQ